MTLLVMRCNAVYFGAGRDDAGIPCRYYVAPLTGQLYRAYDCDAIERAQHRLRVQPPNDPGKPAYHKKIRRVK